MKLPFALLIVLVCPFALCQTNTGTTNVQGTLTANIDYGVVNATQYGGSDPCAQINAAITAASNRGYSVVSAEGFTGNQSCTTSILIPATVTLRFPATTWTLSGNPGISVQAPGVVIRGQSEQAYQTRGTQLRSGGAHPLIANLINTLHAADGTALYDLDLNCNNTGTFAFFAPASYDVKIDHVHAHLCKATNVFTISGHADIRNLIADNGTLDCIVVGYDGQISGVTQANDCGGNGIHIVSGGMALTKPTVYHAGMHGIYLDGEFGGDWSSSSTFLVPGIVCPANVTKNPGHFCYYTQELGTTAGSEPSFCQAMGCTTTDNTVTWINIGTCLGYGISGNLEFYHPVWTTIEGVNVSESGHSNLAGSWCNINIHGVSGKPAMQNNIIGSIDRITEFPDYPAYDICETYALHGTIVGQQFYGNGGSGFSRNDLGALRLVNCSFITVIGSNTFNDYSTPVQLQNSQNITINEVKLQGSGAGGHFQYGITADDTSTGMISDVIINDNRGIPYSYGLNLGTGSFVVANYMPMGLASSAGYSDHFTAGSLVSNYLGGLTAALISGEAMANGTVIYCSDCTVTNPATCTSNRLTSCVCAGSGSGAFAKRVNGNWYCN